MRIGGNGVGEDFLSELVDLEAVEDIVVKLIRINSWSAWSTIGSNAVARNDMVSCSSVNTSR